MLGGAVVACGGRSHSDSPAGEAAGSGATSSTESACDPDPTRVCRRGDPVSIDYQLGGAGGDSGLPGVPVALPPPAGSAGAPTNGGSGNVAGAPASQGSEGGSG